MQREDDKPNDVVREKAIYRYVQALDDGDLEAVAAVLDLALDDRELDEAIAEIHLALGEEENLTPLAADAEIVRGEVRKHLRSASEPREADDRPMTIGEVAARLKADRRVPFIDQDTNERLLTEAHPLPAWLNMSAIKELATQLQITASDRYWRAFRDVAIMLGMGRSHQSQLLAAREERLRRDVRKQHDRHAVKSNADAEGDE